MDPELSRGVGSELSSFYMDGSDKLGQSGSNTGDPVYQAKTGVVAKETQSQSDFDKLGQRVNVLEGVGAEKKSLEEAAKDFLKNLRRMGYAEKTVVGYERTLLDFAEFSRGLGTEEVSRVGWREISGYRDKLFSGSSKVYGRVYAASTQLQRLLVLKMFFRRELREGRVTRDPSYLLRLPKLERKISKNYLGRKEMFDFLSAIDVKTVHGFYDRTLFELAYAGALRSNEVLEARTEDVDLEESFFRVRGAKGGEERMVILTSSASVWMRLYLEKVRKVFLRGKESDYLFPATSGRRQLKRHLIDRVREYTEISGLVEKKKSFTFHAFRRSAATHLLEAGADLRLIQELLGHRNLASTEIYLATTTSDLREVLIRHHPLERKEKHAP